MTYRPGTVERAYQLAREGLDLPKIRETLKAEGYSDGNMQLSGSTLTGALRRLAKAAQLAGQDEPAQEG